MNSAPPLAQFMDIRKTYEVHTDTVLYRNAAVFCPSSFRRVVLSGPWLFQVLSDDEKRPLYDRFGEAGVKGAGAPGMVSIGKASVYECAHLHALYRSFRGRAGSRTRPIYVLTNTAVVSSAAQGDAISPLDMFRTVFGGRTGGHGTRWANKSHTPPPKKRKSSSNSFL